MKFFVFSIVLSFFVSTTLSWGREESSTSSQDVVMTRNEGSKVSADLKQNPQRVKKNKNQTEKNTKRLNLFLEVRSVLKTPHISDDHSVKLFKIMSHISTSDLEKIAKYADKLVTSDMYFADIEEIVLFLRKMGAKRVKHLISVKDSFLPDHKRQCLPFLLRTIGSLSEKNFDFLIKNTSVFIGKNMSCDTLDNLIKALSSFPKNRMKTLIKNKSSFLGEDYSYHWPSLVNFLGNLDNDLYYKVIKYIPKLATKEMSSLAIIDLVKFISENDFSS